VLYTISHGAKTARELIAALRQHDVAVLVDVRSFPGSRRNPDVSRQVMPDWLTAAGIAYRHEPDLGGRRKPSTTQISRDKWWENQAFANYSAHTRTPVFKAAYLRLVREADAATLPSCAGNPPGGGATDA
jgi:uncharacterized protein (DUF488 family)